jgi:hypothetical protein
MLVAFPVSEESSRMPGPAVHFRLTMRLAMDAGFSKADAEEIGRADVAVDELWPGRTHWWLHFNPTTSLIFAPLELRRARRAERAGDHESALTHLGRSLHMRQDSVGHGRPLGLNHLAWDVGLLRRNPDEWELMPQSVQARIERATRRALRLFLSNGTPPQ